MENMRNAFRKIDFVAKVVNQDAFNKLTERANAIQREGARGRERVRPEVLGAIAKVH